MKILQRITCFLSSNMKTIIDSTNRKSQMERNKTYKIKSLSLPHFFGTFFLFQIWYKVRMIRHKLESIEMIPTMKLMSTNVLLCKGSPEGLQIDMMDEKSKELGCRDGGSNYLFVSSRKTCNFFLIKIFTLVDQINHWLIK